MRRRFADQGDSAVDDAFDRAHLVTVMHRAGSCPQLKPAARDHPLQRLRFALQQQQVTGLQLQQRRGLVAAEPLAHDGGQRRRSFRQHSRLARVGADHGVSSGHPRLG